LKRADMSIAYYNIITDYKDEILQIELLGHLNLEGNITLRFGCHYSMCGLTDSFKIPINAGNSNSGWRGGCVTNLPNV
jgi:hypothetical protein